MTDERIHILRDILLELHNGASPESVQDRFDATFTGVSAIEISLMEHELMNSDSGVTFEDVMELCDVHANLFKIEEKIAEEPVQLDTAEGQVQQVIDTPEGHFTITFTPKEKEAVLDRHSQQAFGNGYLSVEQANLILNHLPMEITFVNKEDIFQYYNDNTPADEMIFKRTPSQVGRNVELCHPPKYLDKVKTIMKGLREGSKDKYEMWFKSESRGKFVHITYAAVHDEDGEFQGVLEYVQDIQPYREIDTDYFRGLE